MEQFISLLVSFFAGGGIMMVTNYKINQKSAKIDYADKMINFMKSHNIDLIKRIKDLELKVDQLSEELSDWRCNHQDCKIRLR